MTPIFSILAASAMLATIPDGTPSLSAVEESYLRHAARADSLVAASDWSGAEKAIISTLRNFPANPSNTMLFYNLGVCQLNLGKPDEAIGSFDIALVKAPEAVNVLTNRARACLMTGRDVEALANLDAALTTDSTQQEPRVMRAFIHLNRRDFPAAYSDFSRLLDTTGASSMQSDPFLLAGAARAAALTGRTDRASELYSKALDTSPDADTAVEAIAHFLATAPEDKTQQLIIQQIKRHPQEGRLYLMMAAICKRRFLTTEMEANKKIAKQYGIDSQTIENFLKNN